MITFVLDEGRITALYHGPRRGRKAIGPISDVTGGTYRFETTGPSGATQDLPSTPELLDRLRNPPTAGNAEVVTAGGASNLSPKDKNKICLELKDLLATHLGPIAGIVFDGALSGAGDFCTTHGGTQEFIEKLAEDIEDASEAAEFREKANAVLGRILEQHGS
ncbi:MAG: hypothetical protein U9R74_10435 [Pseudomonadota bacterium]|nr:hypothetical protein [Pseudomonadota bacterium]